MKKPAKTRLDQRVLDLDLAETRSQARALVMAGKVTVDGEVRDKPGEAVASSREVALLEKRKYVSRGGHKLEGPLDKLDIDPQGLVCLDLGSSTGGFTDCLLQKGAARVFCVDVGKGLLDWKLRQDPRVEVREQTNARYLTGEDFPPLDLVLADLSFISLELILPAAAPLLKEGGLALCLVKPQFEAGRDKVEKGGVVREEKTITDCVNRVSRAARGLSLAEAGRCPSPLQGPKGNREVFVLFRKL
ncbi:MAG: TlyA family RNA methyltransferase [bacterium]